MFTNVSEVICNNAVLYFKFPLKMPIPSGGKSGDFTSVQ